MFANMLLLALAFLGLMQPALADGIDSAISPGRLALSSGFPIPKIEATYYFDSRGYNTLNIQNAVSLPCGFDFWGFTDIHGNQHDAENRHVFKRSFMEQRLRREFGPDWVPWLKGLGVEAEYNGFNGTETTALRYGVTYRHPLPAFFEKNSWLQWRYHPIETFARGQQASVIYRVGLGRGFFITGFADYNFDLSTKPRWNLEPQLNYTLNPFIDIAIELRYNAFEEAAPKLDGFGIAPGAKMKF